MKKRFVTIAFTAIMILTFSLKSYGQVISPPVGYCGDSLTFSQQLSCISANPGIGMRITFVNIDTLRKMIDVKIDFYFSKNAIDLLQKNILQNDSSIIKNKLPKSSKTNFNSSFVIKNIKVKWVKESLHFISIDSLFVFEINGKKCPDKLKGKLVFASRYLRGGFILYVETQDKNWYFFKSGLSSIESISSNSAYNLKITETRPNKRKIKGKKGDLPYYYTISTDSRKKNFMHEKEFIE